MDFYQYSRPKGTSAYYCIEDPLIFELCHLVCNRLAERIEEQARQFRDFSLASKK